MNSNVSFFEPVCDPQEEARAAMVEALSRMLIWMADAPTLEKRGVRASVALYCVRPDLIGDATLADIGEMSGNTPQAVHKLVDEFRFSTGLKS